MYFEQLAYVHKPSLTTERTIISCACLSLCSLCRVEDRGHRCSRCHTHKQPIRQLHAHVQQLQQLSTWYMMFFLQFRPSCHSCLSFSFAPAVTAVLSSVSRSCHSCFPSVSPQLSQLFVFNLAAAVTAVFLHFRSSCFFSNYF